MLTDRRCTLPVMGGGWWDFVLLPLILVSA